MMRGAGCGSSACPDLGGPRCKPGLLDEKAGWLALDPIPIVTVRHRACGEKEMDSGVLVSEGDTEPNARRSSANQELWAWP